MARCRVTYLEVADARPLRDGAGPVVDLDADEAPPEPDRAREPDRVPGRRSLVVVVGAAVAVLAAVVLTSGGGDEPEPLAVPEPSVAHPVPAAPGPVPIDTASIVAEPWSGVFEHHPDVRQPVAVPRVHLLALEGPRARAVLVVDATRRAFGGAAETGDQRVRVLGAPGGAGVRTLQWDEGGYGLSLTAVGLRLEDQRGVAGAVLLPPGPSLQHGRSPRMDQEVLSGYGLGVATSRSGVATAFGSPMIGQSGRASIEGQLHQSGASPVLVSVVEDQLVTAARLRHALGEGIAVDVAGMPGISEAVVLDHGAAPVPVGRIRGWTRLVLDHPAGVTIELSSDVASAAQLRDAAAAMDLDRLARTAAPTGGG